MLPQKDNELLTQIGADSPMGQLMRRYWIPALLSEEIPQADCPPVRVKLLGEDLVAFRDSSGQIGLLDEHCSHRGTSLFFGRNEECGLRCVYHGWKYDVQGKVIETPAEPQGSRLKEKVQHTAYPCREANGIIFTYMGPKAKVPVFPEYPWLRVPRDHAYIAKSYLECNYLQGLEGDCDSSHLNYLHREFVATKERDQANLRDRDPFFETEETDVGLKVAAIRKATEDTNYVRTSYFVMPCVGCVPVGRLVDGKMDGFKAVYQVPADETNTWRYDFFFKYSRPFGDKDSSKRDFIGPDYRKIRNRANNYLQNREAQKSTNYTGIEEFLNQDACATESMGPVVNRSREHLGVSDTYIIALRRFLLKSVRDFSMGKEPPGLIYDEAQRLQEIRCVLAVLPADMPWRPLFD